jgi:hypothetical protein
MSRLSCSYTIVRPVIWMPILSKIIKTLKLLSDILYFYTVNQGTGSNLFYCWVCWEDVLEISLLLERPGDRMFLCCRAFSKHVVSSSKLCQSIFKWIASEHVVVFKFSDWRYLISYWTMYFVEGCQVSVRQLLWGFIEVARGFSFLFRCDKRVLFSIHSKLNFK